VAEERRIDERVSLIALFFAFLQVSSFGFGGGLVWARRIVVERRRWVGEEEFTDILSFCQFMPGPNIVGIAVCTGARLRGLAGTLAATAGFLLIPGTVGFALGLLYLRHANAGVLHNILGGVSAAAAGLLIATGIRMLLPHRRRPVALIVAAFSFAGMAFTGLPLLVVLFGMALIGIATARVEVARAR
jgi:chromate transporter